MDAAWMQSAAHALAKRIGLIPPAKFSADGARELLREACRTRSSLNHEISRVEDALLRSDLAWIETECAGAEGQSGHTLCMATGDHERAALLVEAASKILHRDGG